MCDFETLSGQRRMPGEMVAPCKLSLNIPVMLRQIVPRRGAHHHRARARRAAALGVERQGRQRGLSRVGGGGRVVRLVRWWGEGGKGGVEKMWKNSQKKFLCGAPMLQVSP